MYQKLKNNLILYLIISVVISSVFLFTYNFTTLEDIIIYGGNRNSKFIYQEFIFLRIKSFIIVFIFTLLATSIIGFISKKVFNIH